MTATVKVLIQSKQAENIETPQYTATNVRTIIDKFTVTNTTVGVVVFTARIIPSGGSAAASNAIISARSIAAGECYTCPELVGHLLSSGDFISTLAGAATSLTIRAAGREIT